MRKVASTIKSVLLHVRRIKCNETTGAFRILFLSSETRDKKFLTNTSDTDSLNSAIFIS